MEPFEPDKEVSDKDKLNIEDESALIKSNNEILNQNEAQLEGEVNCFDAFS